ncbi:zinc finger protein 79-like [Sycon ciliatum]|uniref:zinc finger protein 79-like n=1 Tax=Sycon ciliatum TaxID=27933 RepID=UPI0031F6CE0C
MEDLEESMSDCSVDWNILPPMPPLMKSKRNMRDHTSREHGPSSVPPYPASNLLEKNMEKASCMRPASLGKKGDTSNIPPEYTSSLVPVPTPLLIRWTRNKIHSGSTSNRRPAFEETFRTAYESERDETISSTPSEVEDVVNWTSAVSGYEKRASHVRSYPQFEVDALIQATASNTGVSAGRTTEIWENPDACDMPVGHRRPIRQNFDSSKAMAQNQVSQKRSKNKTSQRCQYCQKEFKTVSHLRVHERVHTRDRPFKCDVCGKSFTQSCRLCAHKRTHTGDRPFKCDVCGKSFAQSGNLCVHKRTHTGDKPFKCDICGKSFSQSGSLCVHNRTHTGERPHKCKKCGTSFTHLSSLRRHERIHSA